MVTILESIPIKAGYETSYSLSPLPELCSLVIHIEITNSSNSPKPLVTPSRAVQIHDKEVKSRLDCLHHGSWCRPNRKRRNYMARGIMLRWWLYNIIASVVFRSILNVEFVFELRFLLSTGGYACTYSRVTNSRGKLRGSQDFKPRWKNYLKWRPGGGLIWLT